MFKRKVNMAIVEELREMDSLTDKEDAGKLTKTDKKRQKQLLNKYDLSGSWNTRHARATLLAIGYLIDESEK